MKHLKRLFNQPLSAISTKLAVFLLVVALLGFIDSGYLTIEHYQGAIPPCSVVSGCETVLTSSYSVIMGVPVSLLGAIFYFIIMVGALSFIESRKTTLLKWTLMLTVFGMLFTLWFLYVQAFIIGAWCLYCLGSALTSTVLFITAIYILKKHSIAPFDVQNI